MPQSQTADKPTASQGRDRELRRPQHNLSKVNLSPSDKKGECQEKMVIKSGFSFSRHLRWMTDLATENIQPMPWKKDMEA